MATYDSIQSSVNYLETTLIETTTLRVCLNSIETDDATAAAWIGLLSNVTSRIEFAAEALINQVNTQAIPLLRDMADLAEHKSRG